MFSNLQSRSILLRPLQCFSFLVHPSLKIKANLLLLLQPVKESIRGFPRQKAKRSCIYATFPCRKTLNLHLRRLHCTGCPPLSRDIIFVIDGSGSVGRKNFRIIREWIVNLAKNFSINDGTNRIGVIQYSHYFPSR